jgi:hypothetical protein
LPGQGYIVGSNDGMMFGSGKLKEHAEKTAPVPLQDSSILCGMDFGKLYCDLYLYNNIL